MSHLIAVVAVGSLLRTILDTMSFLPAAIIDNHFLPAGLPGVMLLAFQIRLARLKLDFFGVQLLIQTWPRI